MPKVFDMIVTLSIPIFLLCIAASFCFSWRAGVSLATSVFIIGLVSHIGKLLLK